MTCDEDRIMVSTYGGFRIKMRSWAESILKLLFDKKKGPELKVGH